MYLRFVRSFTRAFSKSRKQQLVWTNSCARNKLQSSGMAKQVLKVISSSESIRSATEKDYEDIMAIDFDVNIQDSRIPHYFPIWMKEPIFYPYVYIVNGKTVGFICLMSIDDGSTGVLRVVYLMKAYQKRGMVDRMCNAVMEIHGDKKDFAAVAYYTHNASRDFVDEERYKYVIKKKVSTFKGSKDHFDKANVLENMPNIQLVEQADLQRLIQNKEQYPQVFDDKRLVIDTVPYQIIDQNIPIICSKYTTIYGSFLKEPEKPLLTFGTRFRLTSGEICCKLTVYGTMNEYFQSHILGHIDALKSDIEDKFLLEIAYENKDEEFIDALVNLGLQPAPNDVYNRVQMIIGVFGYPIPPFIKRPTVAKL